MGLVNEKAIKIYHTMRSIAEPIHAYSDQFMAIAKWIESEFIYKPDKAVLPIVNTDNNNQWINVSDMLPTDDTSVLCVVGDNIELLLYNSKYFNLKGFWLVENGGEYEHEYNNVTHWMPLPNHPINTGNSNENKKGTPDT